MNPTGSCARGHRWRRAYVDVNLPIKALTNIVVPSGSLKMEEYKLFNW